MANVTMPPGRAYVTYKQIMPRGSLTIPLLPGSKSDRTNTMPILRMEVGAAVASLPIYGSGLPAANYKMEGHVYQRDPDTLEDTPIPNCEVWLFVRENKRVIARGITDENGYYKIIDLTQGVQYFAVAFDVDGSPLQNAVILDKLVPVAP